MAGEPFQRRSTLPPARPPSDGERLTRLETNYDHVVDDLDQLLRKVSGLGDKFDALNTNVTILTEQRNAATKGKERLIKWIAGVSGSLFVLLVVWLAGIAWVVQTSKVASP